MIENECRFYSSSLCIQEGTANNFGWGKVYIYVQDYTIKNCIIHKIDKHYYLRILREIFLLSSKNCVWIGVGGGIY